MVDTALRMLITSEKHVVDLFLGLQKVVTFRDTVRSIYSFVTSYNHAERGRRGCGYLHSEKMVIS